MYIYNKYPEKNNANNFINALKIFRLSLTDFKIRYAKFHQRHSAVAGCLPYTDVVLHCIRVSRFFFFFCIKPT